MKRVLSLFLLSGVLLYAAEKTSADTAGTPVTCPQKMECVTFLDVPVTMAEGDVIFGRARIRNNTETPKEADLSIHSEGRALQIAECPVRKITIPPHGTWEIPFIMKASGAGNAAVILAAEGGETFRSSVRRILTIRERALEKNTNTGMILFSGNSKAVISLSIPADRKKETLFFRLEADPGIAWAVFRLLPYTVSSHSDDVYSIVGKFLPVYSVWSVWKDTGIDPERDSSLQKVCAEQGFPSGKEMRSCADEAVRQLIGMQNRDGGWSWFPGSTEPSCPDTTAYALDALLEISMLDVAIPQTVLDQAGKWLWNHGEKRAREIRDRKVPVQQEDTMVVRTLSRLGKRHEALERLLFARRKELSPMGLAWLGQALPAGPEREAVIRDLKRNMILTENSACLNISPAFFRFWYGDEICSNAAFLDLLAETDPDDPAVRKLADSLAAGLVNAPYSRSVRALEAGIRSLCRYLHRKGELRSDFTFAVSLDGKILKRFRVTPENFLKGPLILQLGPEDLKTGDHEILLEFSGRGKVFTGSRLSYVSGEILRDPYGLEMQIHRTLYRISGMKKEKIPPNGTIAAGERIEAELSVTSKADYDYVLIRMPLPGGMRWEDPSGIELPGIGPVREEYGTDEVRFYCRNVPRGTGIIRVRMLAVQEGNVSFLPASAVGIYSSMLRSGTGRRILEIVPPSGKEGQKN